LYIFHFIAIRSGDYYMFEEVEDEFELEIIDTKAQEEEEERQSTTRRRLSKKTSFGQVGLHLFLILFLP
jgi:piezo-type mechanosensitive ion channel component 1/2